MRKRRITQAVIVIHGIGEQKPMDTLRNFVDAVLPEPKSGEKYLSRPDQMSESFELRKLQNRKQPRTHFFEYYWASKVEGTTLQHVWTWLRSLLFRRPWRVPGQLIPLWVTTWILAIGVIAFGSTGLFDRFAETTIVFPSLTIATIGTAILAILQSFVIYYVGDAARYLSPHPKNIALRQTIRSEGIKLLRNIVERGKYERVVLVGHSLGSVIAYDILKHLWQDYHKDYRSPTEHDQTALESVEKAGEALRSDDSDQERNIDDFQNSQIELWRELRDLGNPWLVTDLITLGSPLAHAALLLASDEDDLKARQRQRELPTAPPVPEVRSKGGKEVRKYSYRVWDRFKKGEKEFYLRVLHHAAHFACTRWTNLYFPVRLGFFGDFIGGPLRNWFGPGIRDIPVTSSRWIGLAQITPIAHNSYWWKAKKGGDSSALAALIHALDLDGKRTYSVDTAIDDDEFQDEIDDSD
jgi:hypothetical protein